MMIDALVLAAFVSATPMSAIDNDPILVEQVRCREAAFSDATENRDRQQFLAFVDPDARFINQLVTRGHEAIGNDWSAYLDQDGPSIRWRSQFVEISASGDLALSRGPYRIIGEDGEETWGHFTSTWRFDGNNWLVLFDSGGDYGMTPSPVERSLLDSNDCKPSAPATSQQG